MVSFYSEVRLGYRAVAAWHFIIEGIYRTGLTNDTEFERLELFEDNHHRKKNIYPLLHLSKEGETC